MRGITFQGANEAHFKEGIPYCSLILSSLFAFAVDFCIFAVKISVICGSSLAFRAGYRRSQGNCGLSSPEIG
jgi:hypothetical protein